MSRSPAPNAAQAAGLTLVASAFIADTTLFAKFLATSALGHHCPRCRSAMVAFYSLFW